VVAKRGLKTQNDGGGRARDPGGKKEDGGCERWRIVVGRRAKSGLQKGACEEDDGCEKGS
jgi:hypothetical protein